MPQVDLDCIVTRAGGLFSTELDGEIVLMSVDQGSYYGVETTARRIWELLESPQRVSELCGHLAAEYQISPEACQSDVLPFLDQLLEEGLVLVA